MFSRYANVIIPESPRLRNKNHLSTRKRVPPKLHFYFCCIFCCKTVVFERFSSQKFNLMKFLRCSCGLTVCHPSDITCINSIIVSIRFDLDLTLAVILRLHSSLLNRRDLNMTLVPKTTFLIDVITYTIYDDFKNSEAKSMTHRPYIYLEPFESL